MPGAAAPAGYSVPVVMARGQGGHGTGTRWPRRAPSSANCSQPHAGGGSRRAPPQQHLSSESSETAVMEALGVCRVVNSGKSKPEGLSTSGDALQVVLPRSALVSKGAQRRTPGSAASGGIKPLRNRAGTENVKTQVWSRCLLRAFSPKRRWETRGCWAMGLLEGPLKMSSTRRWFSRRVPGLSLHWGGFSGCASACREPATLPPRRVLPTGLRARSDRYEGPKATGILGGRKRGEAKE